MFAPDHFEKKESIQPSANAHKLAETEQRVRTGKLRAIIYCRVSTEKQEEEGESLELQEGECQKHADKKGYDVIMVLKEVQSGFIHYRFRKKLTLARQMIREGLADVLIVYDLRRFSRNFTHSALIFEEIQQAGGALESVKEQIDNSMNGQLVRMILSWCAEMERHKIVEYANRHWQSRHAKAIPIGTGKAPHGWDWQDATKSEYVINVKEAAVRYSIYEMLVIKDMSIRAIARKLTEDGILPPGIMTPEKQAMNRLRPDIVRAKKGEGEEREKRRRSSLEWHPTTITYILKDERNIGILTICARKQVLTERGTYVSRPNENAITIYGGIPAIVPLGLYKAAQQKLALNQRDKSHLPDSPELFLLRGHVFCENCGRSMSSKWMYGRRPSGPYNYPIYACKNAQTRATACTRPPTITTYLLDEPIWQECCRIFERAEAIKVALEKELEQAVLNLIEVKDEPASITLLRQELEFASIELKKHEQGSYYHKVISADIQTKMTQLKQFEEMHNTSIPTRGLLEIQKGKVAQFIDFLTQMKGKYEESDFKQKRFALEMMGVKVFVSKKEEGQEERYRVQFSPTFSPIFSEPGVENPSDCSIGQRKSLSG